MSDFIADFRAQMAQCGVPYDGPIIPDGKIHRFKCLDDREANSWYLLHPPDPIPAGNFGCWKRDVNQDVCLNHGRPVSAQERHVLHARFAAAARERQLEEQQRQEQARNRAAAMYENGSRATAEHPYFTKKRVACLGNVVEGDDGKLILPLRDGEGAIHTVQTIDGSGDKRFLVGGRVKGCSYVVNPRLDSPLIICEGYATGATLFEATGWAVVAAMNCGNLLAVAKIFRKKYPERPIIIAADNDRNHAGGKNPGLDHARATAKEVKGHLAVPEFPATAPHGSDFNDLAFSAGLQAVTHGIEKAFPAPLSVLSFDQIVQLPTPESDRILGEHMLDKGSQLVIAGQGGTGKSRLIYQFVAGCVAGHPKFLNLDIHPGAGQLKWLVFQTENSVRRFKQTAASIKQYLGDRWPAFNHAIRVLTPLTDHDLTIALDHPEAVARMQATIIRFAPDVIVFDSLYDFAIGDINKDVDMRQTIMAMSRLAKYNNPKRAMIILHHALTGQGGAAKATGYDRASFARNSKVLFNWTRAQINLAPADENNNDRLVVSCAKCSDGKEFSPFAIWLNPETMLYELDPSMDISAWADKMSNQSKKEPLVTSVEVAFRCPPAANKSQLAKIIMDEFGCAKATAFRYILKAIKDRKIVERNGSLFKA